MFFYFKQKKIRNLLCNAPLNNMLINQQGQVRICCNQKDIPLGTYPENTLHEIWFGNKRKQIINEFLEGRIPDICTRCVNNNTYNNSPDSKIQYSKQYNNRYFEQYPAQIELLLSNHCNFSCIMCNWHSSANKWPKGIEAEGYFKEFEDKFLEDFKIFMKKAKMIVFSGGEPFCIPIYKKIWRMLDSLNSDAKIYIQTNASIYNDDIKNFVNNKNVYIGVSIDAIKPDIYEKIRLGADYKTVFDNIPLFDAAMKKNGKKLTVITTPMTLNAYEMPDIFRFCCDNSYHLSISVLETPATLAIWSLSSNEIKEIIQFNKTEKEKLFNTTCNDNYLSIVYEYYIELLNNYYLQKEKCEKYKNEIINILKNNYVNGFDVFQNDVYRICTNRGESVNFAKNLIEVYNNAFQKAIDADKTHSTSNFEWFHNYVSTKISAEDLISYYYKMGETLFVEMGIAIIKEQLHIVNSNSFFKLDSKPVQDFLNTL